MKTIILFLIYILSFMLFYFVLSLIGILWDNYSHIITNQFWFLWYSLLLGWWMAIFPAREYYLKNESYLSEVFG
jgi:hypothetical protein